MSSNSTVLTLRLEPQVTKQLEKLAKATRRSRAFLAAEAIREYVATNEWQIEEIGKALEEADRGDFATDKEVQKTMKKWTRRAG
jgi:predicted transcriptional regulator